MARHLPLEIQELEIVVVVAPGLLGEIVAAAVQIEEDIVVGIAAAVEDGCVAGVVHCDVNCDVSAHGEEGDVP